MRVDIKYLTLSFLILLLLPSFTACCPKEDQPLPEELLLTPNDLQGEWVQGPQGPHTPTGQAPLGRGPNSISASEVFFYHPAEDGSAGAHHKVWLFRNEQDAEDEFDRRLPIAFNEGPNWVWVRPGTEENITPNASESSWRCTHGRTVTICRLLARYDDYLVDFKVSLAGLNSQFEPISVISMDDVNNVVLKLDERMFSSITDGG